MIVYKCHAKWAITKRNRRYVKTRVSDKNKRRYQIIHRMRRSWFWHEKHWNRRHCKPEIFTIPKEKHEHTMNIVDK